jgi:tRNA dimethylallyltransferase
MKQQVILIAGPTASGKSLAAARIAAQRGGVVVNADAMQVYRDLSIITARPGAEELALAPHHLFGHVDGGERYSVGRWLRDVAPVLKAASARAQLVVIAGGTGLYFKALCEGLSEMPEVPAQIVRRWRAALKEDGPWALHAVLMARDAEVADTIEPGDGQRIVRALAIHDATGKSIRQWQEQAMPPLVPAGSIVARAALMPPREALYDRIEQRFDTMIGQGALDEVSALIARNLDPDLSVMKAIGVPELAAHLAGEMTIAEAIEKAKTASRRYAKRQMTWIRGQMADWPVYSCPAELAAKLEA